jgi:hypothetical protein
MIPQSYTNFVTTIDIQTEQVPFWWQELRQDLDAPAALAHDGFHG